MSAELTCESVARAGLGEPIRRTGAELLYRCPHPKRHKNGDEHPSLGISTKKDVWMCGPCSAKGKAWALAAHIAGVDPGDKATVSTWLREHDLLLERKRKGKSELGPAVAEFVYCDADDNPVCKAVRHEPGEGGKDKIYLWWRYDAGEWKPGLNGLAPPLYNLPAVLAAPKGDIIFLFESVTDYERAKIIGLTGCAFSGSNGWRHEYIDALAGRNVCFVPDTDLPGQQCAAKVCSALHGKVTSLKVLSVAPQRDFRRWVEARGDDGKSLDELFSMYDRAVEWRPAGYAEPLGLETAKSEIAKWLAFEPGEDEAIDMSIAATLANEEEGDPLFLILVAASSSAKTEMLRGLQGAPSAHFLGSLTARTFASGLDPQKTSLLCQLSENIHTLVIKDFGSILAMSPDDRGELLQQLRDIYDGLLIRNWGNGKPPVVWQGRLGLLAGATGAIEREFSALNVLGERFLFFRLPKGNRAKQAERALAVAGHEKEMRQCISKAMLGALESGRMRLKDHAPDCPPETLSALSVLAQLMTQCRTPVIRDRYDKTVDIAPDLEGPARTAKALKKLGIALAALHESGSVGSAEIKLLATVARSNIPSMRRLVIEVLAGSETALSHKAIGLRLGVPTLTVSRLCEDLALLGIAKRGASGYTDAAQFCVVMDDVFKPMWGQLSDFAKGYVPHTQSADRVCAREKLNPHFGLTVPESQNGFFDDEPEASV